MRISYYQNVSGQVAPSFWFGIIFGSFGAIFFVIGAINGLNALSFKRSASIATGSVLEVTSNQSRDSKGKSKTVWNSKISFITQSGQAYTTNVSGHYPQDSQVTVLYDPTSPATARIDSFGSLWSLPVMFSGVGGLFSFIGFCIAITAWRRMKEIARLLKEGHPIKALVVGVNMRTSRNKNGRVSRSWEIVAEGTNLQGRKQRYTSDSVSRDPGDIVGTDIKVLVDHINPNSYFVQLDY